MKTNSQTTHVRASKTAARRITKIGKRMAADIGGKWEAPSVLDKALDALEAKLADDKAST